MNNDFNSNLIDGYSLRWPYSSSNCLLEQIQSMSKAIKNLIVHATFSSWNIYLLHGEYDIEINLMLDLGRKPGEKQLLSNQAFIFENSQKMLKEKSNQKRKLHSYSDS